MNEELFSKEKQDIRKKMLEYSRALKEGKRISTQQGPKNKVLDKKKELLSQTSNESIYLKEDLINVRLEEKKKFSLFSFKKKKKIKKQNKLIKKKPS